jgi:hypothetical protein
MSLPTTLAGLLAPDTLAVLETALAPPLAQRASSSFDVELEHAGEGTYVVHFAAGVVSAKKGFAKGDPLLCIQVPKGALAFVGELLDAAIAGFPKAPEMARAVGSSKALTRKDLDAVVAGLLRMKAVALAVDVKGVGVFSLSRGPLDDAERTLKVALDAAALRALLQGAPMTSLRAAVSGDRGVAADVLSALGPVVTALRPH